MNRYVAALLVVLAVVGVVAVGRGFADEENASRAKCSDATLDGTYLFAEGMGLLSRAMTRSPSPWQAMRSITETVR
jgi:hypothetical protein